MYKTFPVNVSITGSLWILFWISILIASYSEASGPMLTNGLTSALRTPAGRMECESCLMNLHQNASKANTHFSTYLIYAPPIHWSSNSLTCSRIARSWWNPWWWAFQWIFDVSSPTKAPRELLRNMNRIRMSGFCLLTLPGRLNVPYRYTPMHRTPSWQAVEYRKQPIWPKSESNHSICESGKILRKFVIHLPLKIEMERDWAYNLGADSDLGEEGGVEATGAQPFSNNCARYFFQASEICSNSLMLAKG